MRKFLVATATAALLGAPVSAQAASVGEIVNSVTSDIEKHATALWGFLGSKQIETGQEDGAATESGAAVLAGFKPAPLSPRDLALPAVEVAPPALAVETPPKPSIITPLKRLFCVEYARMRSGLAVFGDAKYWWERAKGLYARATKPATDAVMVFSGSKRLARGHLAVVTHVVSPREIIVDQANWTNNGRIELASPVMDVSKNNDWSQVRVWNIATNSYGSRVYAVSGFILKPVQQLASLQN